jgi:flagellar hook-basal body complex protein FliE
VTVVPLEPPHPLAPPEPDAPLPAPEGGGGFAADVSRALADAGDALSSADRAETAFVRGAGGLQEMVLERARADVMLSIATAAASRAAQAVSSILGMQI